MKIINVKQGSAEWLEWRHHGIAATDAASIMDSNPYASPLDVYFDKISDTPKHIEPNAAMEWGSRIEALLVSKFMEMHPDATNLETSQLYESDDNPYNRASLDAECDCDSRHSIIECKTGSSLDKWFKPDGGESVPMNYYHQVQWQMLVTGYTHTYFSVLVNGREWFERSIDADPMCQAMLIQRCAEMQKHIANHEQPAPSLAHAESDLKLMAMKHTDTDDETPSVSDDLYARYSKAKSFADAATSTVEALKLEIMQMLGNHKCLMFGNRKFASIVSRKGSVKLSDAIVKAQFPEVYGKCLITTAPSRYLKVM